MSFDTKRASRKIVERIVITGDLVLQTPTHFGNGEEDPYVDLPLTLDAYDGRPMITGTSLAGALRNALRERLDGYASSSEKAESPVVKLFGGRRGEAQERQSLLIVEDALCTEQKPLIELRDGVAIDPGSGAAAQGLKYDLQLLSAGTKFQLGFELLVPVDEAEALRAALAVSLHLLAAGEIYLGARKRRGFGKCQVEHWKVWRYDLTTAAGLKGSLAHDHPNWLDALSPKDGSDIAQLLGAPNALSEIPDRREFFELEGDFQLDGSLLIRSGFEALTGPDVMHLQSRRNASLAPIISGTSLAGVMRARALKIAQTLAGGPLGASPTMVEKLFGYGPKDKNDDETDGRASRVEVYEQVVEAPSPAWAQQRVRIDRWTGGALDTGLFAEAPLEAGKVKLIVRIRKPADSEAAFLLYVWKDLWASDLPIGGEGSVGRGRLKGLGGKLRRQVGGKFQEWTLASNGALQGADPEAVSWFKGCNAALQAKVKS